MFRLPIVKFFSRILNRATITIVLVALQVLWLLWAFWAFTVGRVWLNGLLKALSIVIVLYLVRKDENSAYKIGWIVLIGLLPLLGGALYLAFGNKAPAKGLRTRMRKVEQAHTADLAPRPDQTDTLDRVEKNLSHYVETYGPYPAWKHTAAHYFPCDDFGSLLGLPSDFVIRMERSHIRCIPFNPVVPLVSLVMNHRDHRKIVVIDGNVAYTGGVNLADEYINAEQRFGYWKDAAIRLEGAAVWNFTVIFLNCWNAFRPQETDYAPFAPTHLPESSDGVVQPYTDSPLDEEPLAETVYLNILAQAQRYVYLYTPYLAVGEEMLDALKTAAKRGVDVRLVLPGIPDKKLVFRLSRSYYVPLLRAGVRIYEYTPGFLHAKCYVSDDHLAVVGSINMDYRSLFLHFECGALLYGNRQVIALREDVLATLPQCREVQLSDCRTSLPGTLLDSVLRLLSPLL